MKRILSFCLALSMLVTTFALQACAEGDVLGPYGSANGQVDDNLSDVGPVFDEQYAVAFTDFEGLTGIYSNGFKLYDSQIPERDTVFYIPGIANWATAGTANTQYIWNGKTLTLFSEPLTIGDNYIISYDYYSVPETVVSAKAYSFAPKHEFFWMGADHINEPAAYNDGKWRTVKMAFEASIEKTDIKVNTIGSKVNSYIDNYLVMEAAEIILNDESGVASVSAVGDNIVSSAHAGDSKIVKHLVAKGDKLQLKVDAPSMVDVTVTVGDDEITPNEDGFYVINKVLDDISIETAVTKASLTTAFEKNAIVDEEDNIYIPYGRTIYSLADDFYNKDGFSTTKTIKAIDSFDLEMDVNKKISANDKLYSKFGDIESDKFNVKFAGDADDDGDIDVTDITSIVGRLVNGTGADNFSGMYDFDANGSVNVTDIVNVRNNILGDTFDTRDAEADIIVDSGVELDFQELDNGVYNAGNQAALANVIRKAMRGEEVILATFGGSITAETGSAGTPSKESGINTTLDPDSYADVMLHWFEDTFAKKYGATFKLINAGIPATDTPYAIHRMYEDVVNAIPGKNPDMVIYEWAKNDSDGVLYKQGTFENGVRKFLKEDIAVLIFSFVSVGGSSQGMQEPISKFYDLPHLSYGDALDELSVWKYLSNDDVHPNRVGHSLAGLIINRYFSSIYNNISEIGTEVPAIPAETYNSEAGYYGETFIAKLADIEAENVEGVRILSRGSFTKDAERCTYGNSADIDYPDDIISCKKEYYGYTAYPNDTGVYEPMVIEVADAKTAFILINRFKTQGTSCKFTVRVDDEQLTCPYDSFNCKSGEAKDNLQIESAYHWATSRLFYNETPKTVKIEITPDLGLDNPSEGTKFVKLFALLLSR